jgi:protein SCO1/2
VQSILGDRVGQDLFFYSITIDPERDTPEVLAEYRERYQASEGWTFLTGSERDITLLRKKLGLYINDLNQEAGDHNLSLIMGNQTTGRWQKGTPFENPYILASQIGQYLPNHSVARTNKNPYEEAPELRNIGDGETLYRTRCQVCHVIGSTAENASKPRVGPDLLGVTERREPEWLTRWIAEPDVMIAEQDPIALGLFIAYNQVPMPNLRLNSTQIGQVLDYIKTESDRVKKHEKLLTVLPKKNENAEVESCCQKASKAVLSSSTEESSAASCCDEGLASDESGASDCCSEDGTDLAERSAPKIPTSWWSGLGVLLGGLALLVRRRA